MQAFKALDVFGKSSPDIPSRSSISGGVLSLVSVSLLVLLLLTETYSFLSQDLVREVKVESYDHEHKLRLDLNLSLYYVPCDSVFIDYEDSMGSHYTAYSIHLIPLTSFGEVMNNSLVSEYQHIEEIRVNRGECGSCYGAELVLDQCCDTCDEVYDAYARRGWTPPSNNAFTQCQRRLSALEGCQIYGHLMLKEVPGAVHFTFPKRVTDLTHTLHHLQVRDYDHPETEMWTRATTPLDGYKADSGNQQLYVLKLTRAQLPSGLRFFEMAGHYRSHSDSHPSTLFFTYDIEPISTIYHSGTSTLQFLTSLCGVLGGVMAFSTLTAMLIG